MMVLRLAVLWLVAVTLALTPPPAHAQPQGEPVAVESPDWTGLTRWLGAGRSARLEIRTGPLDLSQLNPRMGVIIVAPETRLDPEPLLRFVREGGRLMVADEGDASAPLWAALGLRAQAPPRGAAEALPGHRDFALVTPSPVGVFVDVPRLVTNHPGAFAPGPLEPAARFSDGTPFAYQVALGNGECLVLADSSVLINLMQVVPDNARFAANALAWAAEDGRRPVHLLAGVDPVAGAYTGVAPPDEALPKTAQFNRALTHLAAARPDASAVRFFVALLLAAACIYALAVFPGLGGRHPPRAPRIPHPTAHRPAPPERRGDSAPP